MTSSTTQNKSLALNASAPAISVEKPGALDLKRVARKPRLCVFCGHPQSSDCFLIKNGGKESIGEHQRSCRWLTRRERDFVNQTGRYWRG